jgi:hypothetical protein
MRLDPALRAKIVKRAKALGMTMSVYVRFCIHQELVKKVKR